MASFATRRRSKRFKVFIVEQGLVFCGIKFYSVWQRRQGRKANPTYAIIDSQSVDTAYKSEQVGLDGEKNFGHKQHILTDTLGNI